MESLWPNVDINKVDIVSPLHILNEQANHLGEMTKNVVIAEVSKTKISKEAPHHKTDDKGHGRVESRKIWVSTELNDYLEFPHVGQVFCINRHVFDCKKQTEREETVYGITDLTPEEASPERILKLNREHFG
ncbi:MAG TPA: hypothetical protein VJL89_04335 [Thermodesulfovibrionia bacterium]|nr:hypothetical protein [Thermodesulfovibrionia bacterium]